MEEVRSCSRCGKKETRVTLDPSGQMEEDPAAATIAPLLVKSTKQTKKSVTITWTKSSKAKKYVIYGNKYGKSNKMKKLATVTGKSKKFKKIAGKKVKKGTYYKFAVVALDQNNKVVSTSKTVYVASKGGKAGNVKKVKLTKKIAQKAKSLKAGGKVSLKAKAVPVSKKLKVRKLAAMRYESSNTAVATVNAKGVVTGKKKGKCWIYAYAQNGVCKRVRVTVK